MGFIVNFLKIVLSGRRRAPVTDPRGPVFISYRQSDGLELAVALAWALRAAGVPVWHDQTDLPPGDTKRRLEEALESGLSGAVLLVTPEVAESQVVREVELPRLLKLERDASFTFAIGSIVERSPGKLDYEAADRLLRQRAGTLSRLDQQPTRTPQERAQIARAHARRRMQAVKAEVDKASRTLTLDIQTRVPPFATRPDADLVLRLRPPAHGDRRPAREGLDDLAHFLGALPELVALAGAEQLRVRGGAHLSVAYAVGAAIPTTLIGRVDVADTASASWVLEGSAAPPLDGTESVLKVIASRDIGAAGSACVLYFDLLPSRSDGAFAHLLSSLGPDASYAHVRPAAGGLLDTGYAGEIVGEASHLVRDWVSRCSATEVQLLLRCPWGIALLLGRALNTIRVRLYEWEDGPDDSGGAAAPRYLPSLVVRSGAGGSPIEAVVLPTRPVP